MNFKLDLKSWIIVILLVISAVSVYKWYFAPSGNESEILNLKLENKMIQKERDSLKNARVLLEKDFNNLRMNDSLKAAEISRIDNVLKIMNSELTRSRGDFDKVKKELAETRKKIDDLKNNPPNRTGNDLINSLKNKVK